MAAPILHAELFVGAPHVPLHVGPHHRRSVAGIVPKFPHAPKRTGVFRGDAKGVRIICFRGHEEIGGEELWKMTENRNGRALKNQARPLHKVPKDAGFM
jgi:hypothetical protein